MLQEYCVINATYDEFNQQFGNQIMQLTYN